MTRILPLTVLAYPGPQVRAYLDRLRQAGLGPARIIIAVLERYPDPGKTVGAWLPGFLRLPYAAQAQENVFMYWPRQLMLRRRALVEGMAGRLAVLCPSARRTVEAITGPFRYEDYSPRVERVLVSGINDPRLKLALAQGEKGAVLFTGGGIIKPDLLDTPGFRFLHVHPGFLPDVAGADGLLWSLKVRGRIGMSAFYMAPSLDGGDLIARREYEPVDFDLRGLERPDDQTLYRAIFSFFDPLLRAEFLIDEILSKGGEPAALPSTKQELSRRRVYKFMPVPQRREILQVLFKS